MKFYGWSRVVGFLAVASFALPVSAQVEEAEEVVLEAEAEEVALEVEAEEVEASELAREVEAAVEAKWAAEAAAKAEAEAAAAAEADKWTTPKRNQVFFRGAYTRLTKDRGGEVFTDTGGANGLNDDKGGFSIAAGLNLALTDPADMKGLVLLGEIFVEYSRFSKKTVAQTTSALLGGTATSDVHVSELNVTIAPMLRYDGWKVVRPFFIPIGLAFLVNSPPSNDTTYLDVGLHWALGFDFALCDLISLGVDVRYTYAFDQTNTNNSYLSTGGYAAVNF
jgi:hypothetical protein